MKSFTKWSRGLAVSLSSQSEQLNWNVMPSWTFPALISGGFLSIWWKNVFRNEAWKFQRPPTLQFGQRNHCLASCSEMSWKRRKVQFDLAAVWKRQIFGTFPPRPKSGWKVDQLSIFSRVASEPRLASIINFVEGVSSLIVETNISSLRWLWVQRSRSSQRRTLMSFSSRCSLFEI